MSRDGTPSEFLAQRWTGRARKSVDRFVAGPASGRKSIASPAAGEARAAPGTAAVSEHMRSTKRRLKRGRANESEPQSSNFAADGLVGQAYRRRASKKIKHEDGGRSMPKGEGRTCHYCKYNLDTHDLQAHNFTVCLATAATRFFTASTLTQFCQQCCNRVWCTKCPPKFVVSGQVRSVQEMESCPVCTKVGTNVFCCRTRYDPEVCRDCYGYQICDCRICLRKTFPVFERELSSAVRRKEVVRALCLIQGPLENLLNEELELEKEIRDRLGC